MGVNTPQSAGAAGAAAAPRGEVATTSSSRWGSVRAFFLLFSQLPGFEEDLTAEQLWQRLVHVLFVFQSYHLAAAFFLGGDIFIAQGEVKSELSRSVSESSSLTA